MKKKTIILALLLVSMLIMPIAAQEIDFQYSVDIIDNNPDKFWSKELAIDMFWNGTALETPPIQNQTGSFNFIVTTNVPANIWVAIYRNTQLYTGPILVNHSDWLSTNGIVVAATGPYSQNRTTTLIGLVNADWWNETSGWHELKVSIATYNETLDRPDVHFIESWHFYMNATEDVQNQPPSSPIAESVISLFNGVIEIIRIPLQLIDEILALFKW